VKYKQKQPLFKIRGDCRSTVTCTW